MKVGAHTYQSISRKRMLRNRLFSVTALLATALVLSACDSSSGSLISSDIKDLLDPNAPTDATTDPTDSSNDDSTDTNTDNTNTDNNARVSGDTELSGANPVAPVVTSVSSTITIRGSDIVLLIQGSNLPDSLQVNLDNDTSACQVSQLLSANSNSNLANTLEAVCTTSAIINRQVFVKNEAGVEIQGSPLNFSATNINVDSSSTNNSTTSSNTNSNSTPTAQQTTTEPTNSPSNNQDDEPIAGLSELAQTFIPTPTNLTLLDASAGIRLSWDAVASVEGYNLYLSKSPLPQPGASGVTTYTTTQTNFEISEVDVGETYYLAVNAYLGNNESSRSEDLIVQVAEPVQSKYGAMFEISGYGETLASTGIVVGVPSAASVDQSEDGRYTVFLSNADNLTSTPLRGFNQVFLHDKEDNGITLISQSVSGEPANRHASHPRISGDGSLVVFVSAATNLDRRVQTSGNATQVFASNTITGTTNLISSSALSSNRAANYNSFGPVIDSDGSNVVFSSYADDLTSGSNTQSSHLYHFSVSSRGVTKLATYRDATPAGSTSTVQADAITPDGNYLFYQLSIPGTSPTLHRVNLEDLSQETLSFDENISLGEAHVHSVSNDANIALVSYANGTQTGLYSLTEKTLSVLGGVSANTLPKGLSGDGKIAVLWSDEDLLLNNSIDPAEAGSHFILNTATGYMRESALNIQSISRDGLVVLYTVQSDSNSAVVQLQSIQQ